MSYHEYIRWCRNTIDELTDTLSEEDFQAIDANISAKGEQAIMRILYESAEEVSAFVRKTPAQRARIRSLRDHEKRLNLTYSAILHLQAISQMLQLIDGNLEPGIPFRDMAANAILVREKIVFPTIELRPHPNRVSEDIQEAMKKLGLK